MSWAGALAGAGRAAASIANKYIDEELAQERAKVLADLQLESERKREEYQQSPEVQQRRNQNAKATTLAQAEATRLAATEGVNDTAYQGALDRSAQLDATRKGQATVTQIGIETPAKVTAANQLEDGTRASRVTTERELTKVKTDGQIRAHNATKPVDKDPMAGFTPQDKARLAGIDNELKQLYQEVTKAKATADGWDPTKNPGQAELVKRQQALTLQRELVIASYGNKDGQAGIADLAKLVRDGGAPAPEPAAGNAPAAAPSAAPAPARLMDRAAARTDPLAGLSRQQIREKKAELERQVQRWQGKPNGADLVRESQALLDRIERGEY